MAKCLICGSRKKLCGVCGAELHKRFEDFICRAEIIYAIFMTWGYATAAEAIIKAKDWNNFPLLLVATFVLIRFFFAPTRNLYTAALVSEKYKRWHWVVFALDFPLLILHSFAYYTMCQAIAASGENAFRFFQWLVILLSTNVFWLASIALRMRFLDERRHFLTYIKWCINNFITVVLFYTVFSVLTGNPLKFFEFYFTKQMLIVINFTNYAYWVFFWISLLNCFVDILLTSSDYLGFDS